MEDKNTKSMFTNISYSKKQSADPSFDEYRVGFTYKNKEMAYFIFAPKSRHLTEAEAKKQFEALIKSGELKKYADHYGNDNSRRKKVLVPVVALLTAGAIAGATIGTYFALNQQPSAPEVNVVVPETNGLMFSNTKAYKGQDYDTNIAVNKELTDALLPDELKKVVSGNREILATEYTYSVEQNKEKGKLHIPGKYIEDTVTITLELVEPTPPVPPGPTPVVSDYTEIKYHFSGDTNEEGDHNIGFTFTSVANDVTVDWGDGTPVAVTASSATSPTLGNDATIKIYGDADEISFSEAQAFYQVGNNYITSIVFSKNVKTIPMFCFCTMDEGGIKPNLTSVTFSEGVEIIEMGAFYNNKNLKTVSIPSTVTEIGEMSFYPCPLDTISINSDNKVYSSEGSNLIDIKTKTLIQGSNSSSIPSGIKTIEQYAFLDLKELQDIIIPKTVTTIKSEAFNDTHIKSLTFETGTQLKTIIESCFDGAVIDKFANLPDGIETIEMNAFFGATITCPDGKLVLPNTLTVVANSAFSNAKGFTELVLNASLEEIGSGTGMTGSSFTGTEIVTVDATKITTESFPIISGQVFPKDNKGFKIIVASEEVKNTLLASDEYGWKQYENYIKF